MIAVLFGAVIGLLYFGGKRSGLSSRLRRLSTSVQDAEFKAKMITKLLPVCCGEPMIDTGDECVCVSCDRIVVYLGHLEGMPILPPDDRGRGLAASGVSRERAWTTVPGSGKRAWR